MDKLHFLLMLAKKKQFIKMERKGSFLGIQVPLVIDASRLRSADERCAADLVLIQGFQRLPHIHRVRIWHAS